VQYSYARLVAVLLALSLVLWLLFRRERQASSPLALELEAIRQGN